jgi:hypothetical protein
VAFKDKISIEVDFAVSPHPNTLPKGEGINFSSFFLRKKGLGKRAGAKSVI